VEKSSRAITGAAGLISTEILVVIAGSASLADTTFETWVNHLRK